MKALHTLINSIPTTSQNGVVLSHYLLKDANSELIATVAQLTEDANMHRVMWYGGEKHGKSDLTEGGVEGLMDFVAEAA